MSRLWCILAICIGTISSHAQVTGNVMSRVLQIRFNGQTGSAFFIDYEDQQYIVTANHMVAGAGDRASVEIMGGIDSAWHPFDFVILHGESQCSDVAVLVRPNEKRMTNADPIPVTDNFTLGQEAYFLGFPYGLYTSFTMRKGIVALVKHAYVSANVTCDAIVPGGSKDEGLILLDGINNHGFSGGPVVAPDLSTPGHPLKLIGVVSGYKDDPLPLNVNGHDANNAGILANSGIVIAIPIVRATNLIKDFKEREAKAKAK